ncbi:hypothetical protein H112_01298 [Trichophyton rubrum D6]|uniref:Uncharacterized protein n=3 Tax=Trichophyton TaxID=5550 RepID=A0A080WPK8_TRIRC|nr:uncharacterized protein TERG_12583 [Trichophyton rubrum CBS 118892]EZF26543.1 hypothetical protein H100_01293 [Trichophyton rubrum MR850]EZF45624.1 hypothetical protein H102_01288 [Trichophyton rubrum CBS 100081]EZF56296.1 hypothetical protein H103_01297 [Trichophyton rubrum CBS 288.86]EZF62612.1 hypothetical protein H104_04800 [Trichophyton rubrum CBS 289.86]EZF77528.1 hypothetical protein H105_01302 [Trichophyton soudanense CBS 452.61]EZF88136.1 hypothetical protein H110_01297 [Trichophy
MLSLTSRSYRTQSGLTQRHGYTFRSASTRLVCINHDFPPRPVHWMMSKLLIPWLCVVHASFLCLASQRPKHSIRGTLLYGRVFAEPQIPTRLVISQIIYRILTV